VYKTKLGVRPWSLGPHCFVYATSLPSSSQGRGGGHRRRRGRGSRRKVCG